MNILKCISFCVPHKICISETTNSCIKSQNTAHPPGLLFPSRLRGSSSAAPLGLSGWPAWPWAGVSWGWGSVGWGRRAWCCGEGWVLMMGAGYGCKSACICCGCSCGWCLGLLFVRGKVLASAFMCAIKWRCCCCCWGEEWASMPLGQRRGAAGGDRAVANVVTTGIGEAVWRDEAVWMGRAGGLAGTTGIGMTAMGTGGGRGGGGTGGWCWWWRCGSSRMSLAQVTWLTWTEWIMGAESFCSASRDSKAFSRRSSSSVEKKKPDKMYVMHKKKQIKTN